MSRRSVDVMLVLLIIMMLIAPMLQQGVSGEAAAASTTADKPETQEQTVVAVTSDRRLYLERRPIQDGRNCKPRSRRLMETKKGRIVLIKGDEEGAPYSAIMNAWIACVEPTSRTSASSRNARSAEPGWEASDGTRPQALRRGRELKGGGAPRART